MYIVSQDWHSERLFYHLTKIISFWKICTNLWVFVWLHSPKTRQAQPAQCWVSLWCGQWHPLLMLTGPTALPALLLVIGPSGWRSEHKQSNMFCVYFDLGEKSKVYEPICVKNQGSRSEWQMSMFLSLSNLVLTSCCVYSLAIVRFWNWMLCKIQNVVPINITAPSVEWFKAEKKWWGPYWPGGCHICDCWAHKKLFQLCLLKYMLQSLW